MGDSDITPPIIGLTGAIDDVRAWVDRLEDRVEALESRASGVMDRLREIDGYVERLEALELAADSADRSLVEALRQDRWHATYNAAWSGLAQHYEAYQLIFADKPQLIGGQEAADKHDANVRGRLDWLHLAACNIADVAHGPLVKP